MGFDTGMNIYDIEYEELGIGDVEPASLGNKYLLMQEFPSQDVVARKKSAEEAKKAGKEGATLAEGAPTPAPEDKGQEDPKEVEKFEEEVAKLGEELDIIVGDGMWDLTEDFVYKVLDLKNRAESAKAYDVIDVALSFIDKLTRVIYMAPENEILTIDFKLYLVQDLIMPALATRSRQLERIWEFLIMDREAAAEEEEEA